MLLSGFLRAHFDGLAAELFVLLVSLAAIGFCSLLFFFLAAVDSEALQLAYVFHLCCSLERKKFYLLSQLWEYLYMFPSALCSVKAVEWPLERLWTCWHSCQSCT